MKTIFPNGLKLNRAHPAEALSPEELAAIALAQKEKHRAEPPKPKMLGLLPDQRQHVKNLAKVRWGVIWYPQDGQESQLEAQHRQAVEKLIEHRQAAMGLEISPLAYETGWTVAKFLYENGGVTRGNMDTASVPYFLLIVASPERVPWDFQQQLAEEYAVGRLWFDEAEDCQCYVRALVDYETGAAARPRRALVVGTRHAGDPNTQSTARELVRPLYDWLAADEDGVGFQAGLLLGDEDEQEALRDKLLAGLKGQGQPAPALVFTATHGLDEPLSPGECGALVMQDWPGEPHEVHLSHCLRGDQSLDGLDLRGSVAFCFACYSAGVPRQQDWVHPSTGKAEDLSPFAYVARLPQKMLARGLLGFIGHVSKTWGFSYLGAQHAKPHIGTFKSTLGELMRGMPAGHALEALKLRGAFLSVQYGDMLEHPEKYPDQLEIIYTWMARNDCRGHVLLGDPFASLRG